MTGRDREHRIAIVGVPPTPNPDDAVTRRWFTFLADAVVGQVVCVGLHHPRQPSVAASVSAESSVTPTNAGDDPCGRLQVFLKALRRCYQGPVALHLGDVNTPDEVRSGVCRCQAAIDDADWLAPFSSIAPGWVIAASSCARPFPGQAAFELARRRDQCVVLGGTARPGMIQEVTKTNGKAKLLVGLEVGLVSSPASARTRKPATGAAVLLIVKRSVTPEIIRIPPQF